jgi:hypothetical protein
MRLIAALLLVFTWLAPTLAASFNDHPLAGSCVVKADEKKDGKKKTDGEPEPECD